MAAEVSEVFISPDDDMHNLDQENAFTRFSLEEGMQAVNTFHEISQCERSVVKTLREKAALRTTSEQWLDENEMEWNQLDSTLRARPWSLNKDSPFPYPFRATTNAMREVEGKWLGDDYTAPVIDQFPVEDTVLTHLRLTPCYPPGRRVILFTPEFGSVKSYDLSAWSALGPIEEDCDVWVCAWQGWLSWNEMTSQVCRKMLSFGDSVSTVWYGHSAGALVAYEVLKIFEEYSTPNLPMALIVSGCPAPHLFSKQRPTDAIPWLKRFKHGGDLDKLKDEEAQVLKDDFQMVFEEQLSLAQRKRILADRRIIKTYKYKHDPANMKVVVPVLAFSSTQDGIVNEDSVKAWSECSDPGFEHVSLSSQSLNVGHGFAKNPEASFIQKINEWQDKYWREDDLNMLLKQPQCDIGDVSGDVPEQVDFLTVGAGLAGVHACVQAHLDGYKSICLEKEGSIGGIWNYYANKYSQVNTSEIGYRLLSYEGRGERPNKDHSPKHQILTDMFTVAARAKGQFRCNKEVIKVEKQDDETYVVTSKCSKTGKIFKTKTIGVCFAVNRRIGKRRDVVFPDEHLFLGQNRYGYANEVIGLDFWGKRTIVVGSGAFAFENLRTALEHGSRHATILGRRAGTTCPKWVDMIAFLRPLDAGQNTNKVGNALSFEVWRKCYEDAKLPTPDCWEEGLLKPHNHTISVSDLAFIGGHHGMVELAVGEIKAIHPHGRHVILKDGRIKEVDVLIKATGFFLNEDVPKICGADRMYSFGNIDFNMWYQAEMLLDGGQFGSAKGNLSVKSAEEAAQDMAMFQAGAQKFVELGLPDLTSFFKANAFGSGYYGGMKTTTLQMAYLFRNPDAQKNLIALCGDPTIPAVKYWSSLVGAGAVKTLLRLIRNVLDEETVKKIEG